MAELPQCVGGVQPPLVFFYNIMKNIDNMDYRRAHGSLATRMATLQQQMEACRRKSLLNRPKPLLIGACKQQGADTIAQAIALGLRDFGENRVQEALDKWPALKSQHPAVRLHLIGPLQSNKARDAVALCDVIHTIDREKIAGAIAEEAARLSKMPQCLIQVNIGGEPQKHGVSPEHLESLLRYCGTVGLPITGLMAIPPAGKNPAPYFALLAQLAQHYGLQELSMGMSEDFETAIRLGATYVRIGTALFGARTSA